MAIADIANKTVWQDAFNTSRVFTTYQSSGVHTGTPSSGSIIEVWDDSLGGTDFAYMYVNTPERPKWETGTPGGSILLDGTDDYLQAYTQNAGSSHNWYNFISQAGGGAAGYAVYTVAFVFNVNFADVTTAGQGNPVWGCELADRMSFWVLNESGTINGYWIHRTVGGDQFIGIPITAGQNNVVICRIAQSDKIMRLSVNGGTEVTGAGGGEFTGAVTPGSMFLARSTNTTARFKGRIGEFIVWNRGLTTGEKDTVAAELIAKWIPSVTGPPATSKMFHFDASATAGALFTTFSSSGTHTGTPTNASQVDVWAEETGAAAIASVQFQQESTGSPTWQTTTPLMALPCLAFDGTTNAYFRGRNPTGTPNRNFGDYLFQYFTAVISLYVAAADVTGSDAEVTLNHPVIADSTGHFGLYLGMSAGVAKATFRSRPHSPIYGLEVSARIVVNATNVIAFWRDQNNLKIQVNRGSVFTVATDTSTGANFVSDMYCGRGIDSSARFKGRIGEWVVYNATLSDAVRTEVLDWFDRWAPAAPILSKYFRVPTTMANGTSGAISVWPTVVSGAPSGTALVDRGVATAFDGYFYVTSDAAIVDTKYPAVITAFGANDTVAALGGPCWAVGYEE